MTDSWKKSLTFCSPVDYGLYQISGDHPIYGSNALLYLGKASEQCFGTRLKQHNLVDWSHGPISVYLGRVSGKSTPNDERWSFEIDTAERMLIFSHGSAWNTSSISDPGINNIANWYVMNWGQRKHLLPEVSGRRWDIFGHQLPTELNHYDSSICS